jgi:hypothetical protein
MQLLGRRSQWFTRLLAGGILGNRGFVGNPVVQRRGQGADTVTSVWYPVASDNHHPTRFARVANHDYDSSPIQSHSGGSVFPTGNT